MSRHLDSPRFGIVKVLSFDIARTEPNKPNDVGYGDSIVYEVVFFTDTGGQVRFVNVKPQEYDQWAGTLVHAFPVGYEMPACRKGTEFIFYGKHRPYIEECADSGSPN